MKFTVFYLSVRNKFILSLAAGICWAAFSYGLAEHWISDIANISNIWISLTVVYGIAAPGHPFLKAVIEQTLKNIDAYTLASGTGKLAVLKLTGPIMYTLTIEKLLSTAPYRMIESYDEGVRYSIFDKKVSRVHKDHLTLFANHYSVQITPVVLTAT